MAERTPPNTEKPEISTGRPTIFYHKENPMKTIVAIILIVIATAANATGKPDFPNGHDNRPEKPAKPAKPTAQSVEVNQSARAESRAEAKAQARAEAKALAMQAQKQSQAQHQVATGGTGTGGNADATGGAANATGGQVTVSNVGTGSGLTGRMVPDVSATSPITSTSCRNGITAGGSGNGWGGLLGFFTEDEICELRLLWEQFRTAGMHEKADKLLEGMMAMRCDKLSPDNRKLFGDLCPKPAPAESQNVAFSSAG